MRDEEIVALARERFMEVENAESEIRQAFIDDVQFSVGEQWDAEDKAARRSERRPCLTINRMPTSVRQITNDARQNRPSIKVSPIDDKADVETAKIFQGLIRHIENASNADTAYDRALAPTVRGGYGYFRITSEFSDPYSFHQDLHIRSVRNPNSCYLDPSYTEPDGSDANWGFVTENISSILFKAKWPKARLSSSGEWESIGNSIKNGWIKKDEVRIADYYYREYIPKTLLLLSNGDTCLEEELEAKLSSSQEQLEVVSSRETLVVKVHHLKINGFEILERTIWPGRFIPIIPVLGEEIDIDGKRILEGVIRHAKDSQRMYNHWASAETEMISLSPKAPFIGVEGQFEGHENKWKTANQRNHPYLEYRPVSIAGQPAPPPQRNVFEPATQAITNARMLSAEDIKATTGIYDAALGAKSNENSGIAIQRRNVQAQTSNFHFVDNLSKSIRHGGRILVDAIPIVYDAARAIRTLNEEGEEKIVLINQIFNENGKSRMYRFDIGKYDVSVNTGPSFETRRQEAATLQADLIRSYPNLMQIAGDLLLRNLDIPGSQELAERFKKTLPPGLAEDKAKKQVPPEVQAQMSQMTQMIEQLTKDLNEKTQAIETKTIELESKERIEMQKLQVQLQIEMAKLDAQDGLALFKTEIAELQNRMNLLRSNEPISADLPTDENMDPAGPEMGAEGFEQQQPTGGQSPGNPMEYP